MATNAAGATQKKISGFLFVNILFKCEKATMLIMEFHCSKQIPQYIIVESLFSILDDCS